MFYMGKPRIKAYNTGKERVTANLKKQLDDVLREKHLRKLNSKPQTKKQMEVLQYPGERNPVEARREISESKTKIRKELLRLAEKSSPKLTRSWLQAKISRYMTMPPDQLQTEFEAQGTPAVDLWIIRIITEGIKQASLTKFEFLIENIMGRIPANLTIQPKENSSWAAVVSEISNVEFKPLEDESKRSSPVHHDGSGFKA